MFRTKYLRLTKDQRERGVIYSSVLVNHSIDAKPVLHEVFESDPDKELKIERLKDVSFFRRWARSEGWNVVNIVRR